MAEIFSKPLNISLSSAPTVAASLDLEELRQNIQEDINQSIDSNSMSPKEGTKDGGLTIGLTIVGLAIPALGTLFAGLSYWRSIHPNYSITYHVDGQEFHIQNVSEEEFLEHMRSVELGKDDAVVSVSAG